MTHQDSSRGRYLAVAGPIGVGKTLVAEMVTPALGATLVREYFAGNVFLPRLYEPGGIRRWAMACEMAFLPPRLEQLDHIEGLLARGVDVVADWVWWQTPLFARLTLPDDEFDVYSTLVSRLERGLPVPDAVVCLTANLDKLVGRVTRRGRESEKTMSVDYLSQVREAYLGWRTSAPGNTRWLHMDTTNMDFEQDAGARASAVAQICSLMGEQA